MWESCGSTTGPPEMEEGGKKSWRIWILEPGRIIRCEEVKAQTTPYNHGTKKGGGQGRGVWQRIKEGEQTEANPTDPTNHKTKTEGPTSPLI